MSFAGETDRSKPSIGAVRGVLLGGAVGDAMGAPFEGLWSESIPSHESLLQEFHEYHGYPTGQYTDDTQLTLATIESIVDCGAINVANIAKRIAELWRHQSVIGPGGACTQAAERYLASGDHRTMGTPEGQAGNGTAMRTAALGLWFGGDLGSLKHDVAEVSRITHLDSRSVAGGVVIAAAANLLASMETIEPKSFCDFLADSCAGISDQLAYLLRELPTRLGDADVLEFIAFAGQNKPEFGSPIISPFVTPTVLASLYCVLSNPGSWINAVTSAIRLGGDVDTLGAIVGALMGAGHGVDAVPTHLVQSVQDSQKIEVLAARYHAAMQTMT